MALNLSPEQGVKLTKKDRVHVAKKIKQGWKATCLIPDYGFDKNGDIQVMSDRNRRAVKIVKIKDDGIYIEKALKSKNLRKQDDQGRFEGDKTFPEVRCCSGCSWIETGSFPVGVGRTDEAGRGRSEISRS